MASALELTPKDYGYLRCGMNKDYEFRKCENNIKEKENEMKQVYIEIDLYEKVLAAHNEEHMKRVEAPDCNLFINELDGTNQS